MDGGYFPFEELQWSLYTTGNYKKKKKNNIGEVFADPTQYRRAVSGLQYAALTRPEVSYVVNKPSQFMANPL